ncbi:MAG: urease accessory protein UreE [Methylovirgula sp.]
MSRAKHKATMRLIEKLVGHRGDASLAERLHQLEHRGAVDTLHIKGEEIQRRRFRARTSLNKEVAIALPRDQCLSDGAILVLEADEALVVRVATTKWIRFVPRDAAAALELGYHAGNLHWRVKFDGMILRVAQEGARESYIARLQHLIDAGLVTIGDNEISEC